MKRNPYQDAAFLELEIVLIQDKLRQKENHAKAIISKLQSIDPSHDKVPTLRNQLRQKEVDISRTRAHLKALIVAKRKKETEGKKLQFGNRKNELKWRSIQRDMTQELREQNMLLDSLRDVEVRLEKDTSAAHDVKFDLFISHASEDKEQLVGPLAEALVARGLSVWYDEFSLRVGDSLRKSIDFGLANSTFGLVILSSEFFAKNWTQYELNGLVSREMEGRKVILPVWHKVTRDDVMQFSPSLVDKVALNTSIFSIEEIAEKITLAVKNA